MSVNVRDLIYKGLKDKTKHKFSDDSDIYGIGIDSLDLVILVSDAEESLKVKISDEELEAIKTVGDVVKAFEKAAKN